MTTIYKILKDSAKKLDELLKLNREPLYEVAPSNSSKSFFEVSESSLNEIVTEIETYRELLECDFDELAKHIPPLQTIIDNVAALANELVNSPLHDPRYLLNSFQTHESKLRLVLSEIRRIPLLKSLSGKEQSIILIGANGSGKSSLANYLKSSTMPNILVFPAQKHLYFKDNYSYQFSQLTRGTYNNDMKGKSRISPDAVEQNFTKTVAIFVNEYLSQLVYRDSHRNEPVSTTILEDLQRIWNLVIPNIELSIDATKRSLFAKSGQTDTYGVNGLSDGEKVIIQYILEILMIEPKSFIVVDEPETYINISIANKLWDVLIESRQESRFVFITHNIDFIIARSDSKIVWCKSFTYPDKWDLEELSTEDKGFPIELITELVGSRKPILFCEGHDKSSLDYKAFNALFMDEYTVMPVGSCINVKRYTKFYNSEYVFFKNNSIGVIDRDFLGKDEDRTLAENSIFVLPFNEIEMLLVCPEILNATLSNSYNSLEVTEKEKQFSREFISHISKRRDTIALAQIKRDIDMRMETQKIEIYSSLENLKESYAELTDYPIDEKFTEYISQIDQIASRAEDSQEDFMELLRICNLKGEVLQGICNNIENKYADRALNRLSRDVNLRKIIREKYFSQLPLIKLA